jgi:ribose 5-phosphate isomerase A
MNDADDLKARAAAQAAAHVQSGMVVGLGTGSTAAFAVKAIAERLRSGEIVGIVGIPTSERTRDLATELGIPLVTLDDRQHVDLTIDGADEVDPHGNLIKGGGGALLWEKVVAAATERYVIIVDESKMVERLGERCPVPVEITSFGWKTHLEIIKGLGAAPTLRTTGDGTPFETDGGHYLLDCRFPNGIADPPWLDRTLTMRPGVVETGLFLGMSPEVIVGK